MGANRAMRRKQVRETMHDWVRAGDAERLRKLAQNGITQKDLDESYKKGYEAGYLFSAEAFMKKMYAAIAKELVDAGNDRDDVISFLQGVDHRFAVMFDADEEIDDVYNLIGIRFNVAKHDIDRIEVV